jgi:hypothetical protein
MKHFLTAQNSTILSLQSHRTHTLNKTYEMETLKNVYEMETLKNIYERKTLKNINEMESSPNTLKTRCLVSIILTTLMTLISLRKDEQPPSPIDAVAHASRAGVQLARVAPGVEEAGVPETVPKAAQPNPPPPPPATASRLAPLRIHDPPPPWGF